MRIVSRCALLACAVIVMTFGCKPPSTAPSPEEPVPEGALSAEPFSIPSLADKNASISLSSYEGQVVLLDFWATWCPPCRAELPYLTSMYGELKNRGFTLIGMTVDRGSWEDVAGKVKRFEISYPLALADDDVQARYGGIRAVPTKFLLDKKGAVRKSYVGMVAEAQLRQDVEQLLEE